MKNTNLIGISGRAGSGKDTVGAIIQYLTAEDTGRFCLGRIESGKSIDGHHNSTFEVKKFAGKLKTIASLLSGANIEDFEDQEFKKGKMTADWDYELVGEDWVDGQPQKRPMTYREFLQKLGTEAMRDGLHTNVWVNALFADYKGFVKEWDEFGNDLLVEYPNWIITDMRFLMKWKQLRKEVVLLSEWLESMILKFNVVVILMTMLLKSLIKLTLNMLL